MQVFQTENPNQSLFGMPLPDTHTAVALGGFDAIHKGHQAIIQKVVDYAKAQGLTSVVYLFRNQPRSVVSQTETTAVYPLKKRLEILEQMGVDVVIAEWFTKEYQAVSAKTFVSEYLKHWLHAEFVAAGFNYRFGRKGEGDTAVLKQLAEEAEITVHTAACVTVDGEVVSSSRIRKLIAGGNAADAAKCLGRLFSVEGLVLSGNQIGRDLGFPTANLDYPKGLLLPKQGVYVTQTKAESVWYPSITNVGARPTVTEGAPLMETHLLGFAGDLYGKEIEVAFCDHVREIQKFESLASLKAQLQQDLAKAKQYFQIEKGMFQL